MAHSVTCIARRRVVNGGIKARALMKVLGSESVLLLSTLFLQLHKPCLLGLACLVDANGGQERLEVLVEILIGDAKIPVEKEQKLFLHEIHFSDREAKVLVPSDSAVSSPVLVLWGRVVKILRGKNEGGKEDTVYRAPHTLGNRR